MMLFSARQAQGKACTGYQAVLVQHVFCLESATMGFGNLAAN
jgi:hypothetical protein